MTLTRSNGYNSADKFSQKNQQDLIPESQLGNVEELMS